MKEIGAYEAKTRLSELLRAVGEGKEFLITNHGRPVARLIPADPRSGRQPSEVVADLLSFQTARDCRDVNLEDVKQAIADGRR